MSIINVLVYLGILIFSSMTSRYAVGLILVFALSILEIAEYGMSHFMFLLLCELTVVLFVIKETTLRKENSPLLKYNPLYSKNVLPKGAQVVICMMFVLALIVRTIAIIRPAIAVERTCHQVEYRREANAFINKIVKAYKNGEDYHGIARTNPFPNDAFVSKVVSLLEFEYGRIDAMNQDIAGVLKLGLVARNQGLARIAEECVKESSNVVRRIEAAGIDECNAAKMAKDFSNCYIRLRETCCEAAKVDAIYRCRNVSRRMGRAEGD